jgi:hypothetical protein
MNKLVENERTKLLAGFCNTVAAAFLTTGIIAPVVTMMYGLGGRVLDINDRGKLGNLHADQRHFTSRGTISFGEFDRMTTLQIYALVSPVLALAVVGGLMLVHHRQHARAMRLLAESSSLQEGATQRSSSMRNAALGQERSFAK